MFYSTVLMIRESILVDREDTCRIKREFWLLHWTANRTAEFVLKTSKQRFL